MCAACLRDTVRRTASSRGRLRRLASVGMALAGVALAWAMVFSAAEGLLAIAERSERVSWQGR